MAGILLGVETTEDNCAAIAIESANIETQCATLDKALSDHAVNHEGVRRIPTIQIRRSAHDADTGKRTIVCDTENLVANIRS